jgi:thiamine pyrophosphate-dependent acetolactate synthase large subunit-like protein
MERREALQVVAEHRGDAAVITTMSAVQDWVDFLSPDGLDFNVGGAMGYASSIGLGIALARPPRTVIVIDGDGSLIMNLGTLITIASLAPTNLVHLVLENDMYELTGGEPTPGNYDLPAIGRACGLQQVHRFDDAEVLAKEWPTLLAEPGPHFVSLRVAQGPPQPLRKLPADQYQRFTAALRPS